MSLDKSDNGVKSKEVFKITAELQTKLGVSKVEFTGLISTLRIIRCLLHSDSDSYVQLFINCSLHSIISMHRAVLLENADATEEALRCVLPLCKHEHHLISIAEDMFARGAHIFCINAMRRFIRRKNMKVYGLELISLLVDCCFGNNAAVFPLSAIERQRSLIVQDCLVHGGVSLMCDLLVQYTSTDLNFISLYRLLICVRFILFYSLTDVALKMANSENFVIILQLLRVLIPELTENRMGGRSAFDEETKCMMVQVLICFIGCHSSVMEAVCRIIHDNSRPPSPPATLYTGLYHAFTAVPSDMMEQIPISILESAIGYTQARISKLLQNTKSAPNLSDLVRLKAFLNETAVTLRKQEQQQTIGKFLQNVMKGKVNPSASNIMSDRQLMAASLPLPKSKTSAGGGIGSAWNEFSLFDLDNNNLVNDVKDANNYTSNEDLSREYWMQSKATVLSRREIEAQQGRMEPIVKRLQTNPLGRRVDPFRQSVDLHSTSSGTGCIAEADVDHGEIQHMEQYISPTLELILKEKPHLIVNKNTSPSKPNSNSPSKSVKTATESGTNINTDPVDNESSKQPPYLSPLDMIRQSPYLSKYSIDVIAQKEKDAKQRRIQHKKDVAAAAAAELRNKRLLAPVAAQVPLSVSKDNRIVKNSPYHKDIFDLKAAAERLFEPMVGTKDGEMKNAKALVTSKPGTAKKQSSIAHSQSVGSGVSVHASTGPQPSVEQTNSQSQVLDNSSTSVCPLDKLTYAERLQVMIMQIQKENDKIDQHQQTKKHPSTLKEQSARKKCLPAASKAVASMFVSEIIARASKHAVTQCIIDKYKSSMNMTLAVKSNEAMDEATDIIIPVSESLGQQSDNESDGVCLNNNVDCQVTEIDESAALDDAAVGIYEDKDADATLVHSIGLDAVCNSILSATAAATQLHDVPVTEAMLIHNMGVQLVTEALSAPVTARVQSAKRPILPTVVPLSVDASSELNASVMMETAVPKLIGIADVATVPNQDVELVHSIGLDAVCNSILSATAAATQLHDVPVTEAMLIHNMGVQLVTEALSAPVTARVQSAKRPIVPTVAPLSVDASSELNASVMMETAVPKLIGIADVATVPNQDVELVHSIGLDAVCNSILSATAAATQLHDVPVTEAMLIHNMGVQLVTEALSAPVTARVQSASATRRLAESQTKPM